MAGKPTKREWGTAYHEAGHAVAAYELRLPFRYVTIIPDEEKMTLGHIIYRGFGPDFHPEYDTSPRIRRKLDRAIICSLAGDAAEFIHRGRHNVRGAQGDLDSAVSYILYLTGSAEDASRYLTDLSARARDLLGAPTTWVGVAALAMELIEQKHIGYHKARKIIADAKSDGREEGEA